MHTKENPVAMTKKAQMHKQATQQKSLYKSLSKTFCT